jgi:ATP-dependent DNA helicase RecG
MASRDSDLQEVIGGKAAKALRSMDLQTVADLLSHYPRRLSERGELTDLARLVEGDEVTVQARIESVKGRRIPGRKLHILEVVITSGSARASLSFFNQSWRDKELKPGVSGLFAGKVSRFRSKLQLNSPQYLLFGSGDGIDPAEAAAIASDFAGALIPIYPTASGVPSWTIAGCVRIVLDSLDRLDDPLPAGMRSELDIAELDWAVRNIHRPQTRADYARARRRLAFDEAFGVQLLLAERRRNLAANAAVPRAAKSGGLRDAFADRLPFSFTDEQREVAATISEELAATHPMQRLLQGEVGSGKTVVAVQAMLQVVEAGGQAALLAPTEVLAGQHADTIQDLLGPLAMAGELGAPDNATAVRLLTGSMTAGQRRKALLDAASGVAGIVIGTHALIQDQVQFADLGLVVVDEQHRFGVEQRDALRAKSAAPPHMLVMTATPIPRTVAITVFGDLAVSELRTLPAGRPKITSNVVPVLERPAWLDRVWQRVREEAGRGRQVYVVCPRIGDGDEVDEVDGAGAYSDEEAAQTASVQSAFAELSAGPLCDLRLGLMHGRLAADQKHAVMAEFAAGSIDVLVSTTVIEVGVNVPNATGMVIMDADRFGISQLHQLRGRVGRGSHAPDHDNFCLFLTRLPVAHPSVQRLQQVAATADGFELARIDLEERREGDVLGQAQSGRRSQLKLLSLLRDEPLIVAARDAAEAVLRADPELESMPDLRAFLRQMIDVEQAAFLSKA